MIQTKENRIPNRRLKIVLLLLSLKFYGDTTIFLIHNLNAFQINAAFLGFHAVEDPSISHIANVILNVIEKREVSLVKRCE